MILLNFQGFYAESGKSGAASDAMIFVPFCEDCMIASWERARSHGIWFRCAICFGSWCREGHLASDPTAEVEAPRLEQPLPKYLTADEVDRLLAQPDPSTPLGLRDKAMLELLYATGMRVSELVHVRAADFEMELGIVRCLGKGSKERLIPVGKSALAAVETYLSRGRAALAGKRESPWLFLNRRGGALSRGRFLEDSWGLWPTRGHHDRTNAPSGAPLVCHAPAGTRGGFAVHSIDVGTQ